MSFVVAAASNLTQSTLAGIGEAFLGPATMIVACPSWISDIINDKTTYLDFTGTTPKSLCLLGAEVTYDDFWRLVFIPSLYVGSALTSRMIQYYKRD